MLKIGAAKIDISHFEPGLGLMGWGTASNRALSVALPLHARAFVLEDPLGERLVMLVADLCFITQALRQTVVDKIQKHPQLADLFKPEQIMLSATHTHSAPGGLSHYLFYNLDSRGFSAPTLEQVSDSFIQVIAQAHANMRPGEVLFKQGKIPADQPVAFNRAVPAYLSNREHERKPTDINPDLALDRNMRLLHFVDDKGRDMGQVNWFAVHGTSVHSDNTALHADNKGYAAQICEAAFSTDNDSKNNDDKDDNKAFVAAFAQGACGDVTPNFRPAPKRNKVIGLHDDDDASAHANGEMQAKQALTLLKQPEGKKLHDSLDAILCWQDFSQANVAARFVASGQEERTTPGRIGLRMLVGTAEGPGLPYTLRKLLGPAAQGLKRLKRLRKKWQTDDAKRAISDDNKIPFMDTGLGRRGHILGIFSMQKTLPIPRGVEPMIDDLNALIRRDGLNDKPWTPQVLPLQIARIGELAIVAMPGEFTTTAGRRVVELLEEELKEAGVQQVLFNGYANSYAGYITTPEEYRMQGYEGSSTHFGPHTLGAYLTCALELARELKKPAAERTTFSIEPPVFADSEMQEQHFPLRGTD